MSNENENDQEGKVGSSTLNTHERSSSEEQPETVEKENVDSHDEVVGECLKPFENGHPIPAADVSAAAEQSVCSHADSPRSLSANVVILENQEGSVEPNFESVEDAVPLVLKDDAAANKNIDLSAYQRDIVEPICRNIEAAAPLDIEDESGTDKTVDILHNFGGLVEPLCESVEGSVELVCENVENSVKLMRESLEDSVDLIQESVEPTVSVNRKEEATAGGNGETANRPLKEDEFDYSNLAASDMQTGEPVHRAKIGDYVTSESKFADAEDYQPAAQEEDASYMISYDDEHENNVVESMKIDAEQVDAPTAEKENSSMKDLFLLDENDEGSMSGTEEEQSLFIKVLDNFFKERNMDFKPPKFYGEGLNCLKLWRAVTELGGYDRVTSHKLWRQVGESFRPPKTCTTVSWTFRGFYEKALLDFEREKIHAGEHNVQAPSSAESMGIDNQASGSGRTPRDAAARARQGWHSQRLIGNGEVSDPIVREKSAFSVQKREKQLKNSGSFKRKKQPLEENAETTIQPKVAKTQVDVAVVDIGLPADWVKINVQKTMDCFEVYALVPGLLREEVRVQSDPAGRLVISGDPEQPDNPWGVTPFKKVVNLPSKIDPHQTSAVVTLHGQLFVRVPFQLAEK